MKTFLKSVRQAGNGIFYLLKSQRNGRIEIAVAVAVIAGGILLGISRAEWIIVLLCIALVMSLEAVNSAIETLADKLHPEQDEMIGRSKDMAAGAVLIASLVAAVSGIIIFAPRILNLFF